jgi:putative ABC transport system permease protein
MFSNQFKLIWRRLPKDRQFTSLNLLGLSTGLACAFLIYLWVSDELSVDTFHINNARLFQVMASQKNADGIRTIPATNVLLAQTLKQTMPEVEEAVSALPPSWFGKLTLSVNNNSTKATGTFADPAYFNVFSWHLLQGDAAHVLTAKNSIVVSKDLAMRLFHTTDNIIGKTIDWQHEKTYAVSGIFDGTPAHSSLQFDYVLPMENFIETHTWEKNWGMSSDPNTFLLLKPGTDVNRFNAKIAGFMKTRYPASNETLFARPYAQGYLYGRYENGVAAGGRIEYVRMFSIIAVFILLIACINFMNLSTANASRKVKEVAIKKVIGAGRSTLILQYFAESMLMTALSMALAGLLVRLALPGFNVITAKKLSLHVDGSLALIILAIGLVTSLVAGSNPALYLSGFKPVAIFKSSLKTSLSSLLIRRGLVILQFSLSFIFIVGILIVYRQVQYIQAKDLGYNKDNLLDFGSEGIAPQQAASLLSEMKNIPGVVNASGMDHGSVYEYGTSVPYVDGKPTKDFLPINNIGINYGMIETLGMKMAAGRSFSKEKSADSAEIVINEAAVAAFGLKDPIGHTMEVFNGDGPRKIVGIVKDFHFQSLHENVKPMALRLNIHDNDAIVARIKAGTEKETIAAIGLLYTKYHPGFPFEYRFLDDDFQAQYLAEKRISVLSRYFGGLAILISCLGLFGLVAFTAERRFKEIGIRKVLGATAGSIIFLLSKDFLRLVGIAVLVAFPLAWWAMSQWLNGFAYRIRVGSDIFLIATASILLLTIATISFQSLKAAFSNPVDRLRSE